jgi:regulator of protease activity HflC (stomatin/prohibitin superfamily)
MGLSRRGAQLAVGFGVAAIAAGTVGGCHNPETPAGHEGYVRRGAIIGSTAFHSAQVGPTSTGLGWLLSVENIDVRWTTFSEKFEVMSADNLSLSFHAHVVMRPRPGTVREVVEVYGGSDWYRRNLQQPFRNAVYEAVAGYKALEAKDKREQVGHKVRDKFTGFLKKKPFEVQSIVIGTINLPASVAKAQELKIAKETELERKQFEIDIAKREAQVRVEEAKGIAEAQRIINVTLTPNYLQHEAIKAQEKMASSPNHTTVYIPSGTNGIPIVRVTQ